MMSILNPFIGGVLIAISTSILLISLGRIAGVSGILAGTIDKVKYIEAWRVFFLLGLIVGSLLIFFLDKSYFDYEVKGSYLKIIVAGLLVGYGTQLGSGCTSGHGVCGLARFSKRSLAATLLFMFSGIVTVFIVEHLL